MKEKNIIESILENWENINEFKHLKNPRTDVQIPFVHRKKIKPDIVVTNTETGRETIIELLSHGTTYLIETFRTFSKDFDIIFLVDNNVDNDYINTIKEFAWYYNLYQLIRINHVSINGNIIKDTCMELDMTYKELGESIGYSEGALKTAVSTNKISNSMAKAIELYMENLQLKQELENSNKIKVTLKEWLK